ncbi:retrotransposon protein, putative, ty1-copia subclass [Tanacetum coccineum]
MAYLSAIPRDGIFEIDLSNSYTNDSSMYAISKRAMVNLDFALVWHYRLGHISKKHIEKLQHNGLFDSTDLSAFGKCVSCIPFKTVSRQRASYFVTFTDDFSHYGYVYLLKHKHEVFETFKLFQKEVENHIEKTIKSLRSDHGGEYMSQEFLDHLKEHSIITHRTPPYTPQHNCMSERRNRTLLDMVHKDTTCPRSCLYVDAEEHDIGDLDEPANYKAALLDPESEKWLDAMNVEIQSMKDNEVWNLVYLHPNGKTVHSKWLFKKKTNIDGVVHTFKARLVAKGFTQTYGVDCEETFSPVADIRAIRILIAIAVYYDYEIWQMNVKTAFLNEHLLKKIYRDRSRWLIGLYQSAYIEKILKRFHMENSKRGSIPMQEKLRLSKSQGASTPVELKRMQNVPYASAVGSIIYAVRYRYVFILNGSDVDWKTIEQIIFATSFAEAGYIAAYDAS